MWGLASTWEMRLTGPIPRPGPLGIGPYEGTREEALPQWRKDIEALAACANVVAKLGGINMKVNGFNWH